MFFEEHIYSVLIVSSAEKLNSSLIALLPGSEYFPVDVAESITAAQQRVLEQPYDLIIINTPLPDDFGRKFAVDVCEGKSTVAMILVRSEVYGETYAKVVDYGVLTMRKPTSVQMMTQALDWMRSTRERIRRLEKKALTIEDKMSEIRIVNRAKWALIESCKMTETDAHRYIEKQAMDCCVTRREIAENILRAYKTDM